MKIATRILLFAGALLAYSQISAQCIPDSLITGPPGVYPVVLDQVAGCQYSETDITFLLPRDTTTIIFGQQYTVPFNYFRIDSIKGLPDGMDWACNQLPDCQYDVAPNNPDPDTFGCVRVFGIPSVPGNYTLEVYLTANVTLLGNPADNVAIYSKTLSVGGCVVSGDCYTYLLDAICPPAILELDNNLDPAIVPPGKTNWSLIGDNGYAWQSLDANPSALTLTDPGEYILSYTAEVDTLPWQLDSIVLQTVNCTDLLDEPDLFWKFIDPNGTELVNTTATPVPNATLPLTIQSGTINLIPGFYMLQVWDEDPVGGNDGCGGGSGITFSIPPSNIGANTFTVNGLTATFWVSKPVVQAACSDTFTIFTNPVMPVITSDTTAICGGDSLVLSTTSTDSLLWYKDFELIGGEHDTALVITEPGFYQVEALVPGSLCRAISDWILIDVVEVNTPSFVYDGNGTFGISGADPTQEYLWFNDQDVLQFTGKKFQPANSGIFYAVAQDTATGCQSAPTQELSIILSSLGNALEGTNLEVFPNPATEIMTIALTMDLASEVNWEILDMVGRRILSGNEAKGSVWKREISVEEWPSGLYLIRISTTQGTLVRKLKVD